MKNLFLSLVVFSILFVIGCQENTITDPLSTESSGIQNVANGTAVKNIIQDNKNVPTIIRFENELPSPYPVNTLIECFIVAGTIEVKHQVWQLDPAPLNPQYRVNVKLHMDAEVNCTKGPYITPWLIKGDTEDTFYFLEAEKKVTFTKYYKVLGRSDRMQLVCKYGVTLEGVSLIDMKLRLPKIYSAQIVK